MANSYLTRDFGSAGNRKTMTFSWWYKAGSLSLAGQNQCVAISGQQQSYPTHSIRINQNENLFIRSGVNTSAGGGANIQRVTTRRFADKGAWYHFVVAIDTTQGTASDRVKVYVNGERLLEGAFSDNSDTAINQNNDTEFNKGDEVEEIGRFNKADTYDGITTYSSGHFAHYHFVDGTAYPASTFGEVDSTTGEWKAKLSPSVTYGAKGFFLKFENASALGTDSSGNSNNWSVNGNLKQSISTPNNLFATFNVNHKQHNTNQAVVSSAGTQLDGVNDSYTYKIVCATLGMSKGKWYWETKYSTQGGYLAVGFVKNGAKDATENIRLNKGLGDGDDAGSWAFEAGNSTGQIRKRIRHNNGTVTADMGVTPANGSIIQTWLDLDNGKAWWGFNGTVMNNGSGVGVPNTGAYPHVTFTVQDEFYLPAVSIFGFNGAPQCQINFGEGRFGATAVASAVADNGGHGTFEFSPLAGFYSVCTKNIQTYG